MVEDPTIKKLDIFNTKMKTWYVDFLLSQSTIAMFNVVLILTAQFYLGWNWETVWNNMILYYVIFINLTISKVANTYINKNKVITDANENKPKVN